MYKYINFGQEQGQLFLNIINFIPNLQLLLNAKFRLKFWLLELIEASIMCIK